MKNRIWSPLYAVLFPIVYIAARLFYRRWKEFGKDRFPEKGTPVIIVSNHQNALLDPLLCCLTAPRQLHFLTRADVFRNKLTRPLIFNMNMLPVYRQHDKEADKNSRNKKTFEVAINRLKKGAAIGIFPEGNHGAQKILRPMKRGMAHLLEMAAEMDLKEVKIVPIAVDYSEYNHARSSLVVNYGEPFILDDLLFVEGERKERHITTMNRVKERLSEVMMDIGPKEWYPLLRAGEALAIDKWGYNAWPKIQEEVHLLKEHVMARSAQFESVKELTDLDLSMQSANVTHRDLLDISRSHFGKLLVTMIGFPVALPAIIAFALPWQVALVATKKIVVDPCFNSTFRLVFGLLTILPSWLILSFILGAVFPIYPTWVYLISLLVSGIIALPVMDQIRDGRARIRAKNWARSNPDLFRKWESVMTTLREPLFRSS